MGGALMPALLALDDSTAVEKEHLQHSKPALQNDSTNVEKPAAQGLATDPLIDEEGESRRRHMATIVCANAQTPAAWLIADRLAQSWGFSCAALGAPSPADPEGERRRKGIVQRG